jgi:hypothetical protein
MSKKKKAKRNKKYVPRPIVRRDGGPAPVEGGPQEVLVSERASATPIRLDLVSTETIASDVVTAGVAMEGGIEGPLELLQKWFTSVVTNPRSAADGVEASNDLQRELGAANLEELVTPSKSLPAVERLGLYQYAYHARLVECLADDYPTIQYAIGESAFETLAKKYVEAHPSKNPNLNYFGKTFADFVKVQSWLDHHEFLYDLARLEWAMVEVLHAPAAQTLSLAGLSQLDPERWPGIKLSPAPTLRFFEFDYPVNKFLQAMRDDRKPPIPARAWAATAIYREDFTVWRMNFTRPMANVLSALLAGRTLGDALDLLETTSTKEGDVMVWFREWVSGGFFGAIDLGTPTN